MKEDTKDFLRWMVYSALLFITALIAINNTIWPFIIVLVWVLGDFAYITYLHFHKLHRK